MWPWLTAILSAVGMGGGTAGAAGLGTLESGAIGAGAASGGALEAVGGAASPMAGGTGVGLVSGAGVFPASLADSGMEAAGGGGSFGSITDKIQQLMKIRQGLDRSTESPDFGPPANLAPPFHVPGASQSSTLQGLVASIQARRQRLAQLGLGGSLGGAGGP